MAFDLPTVIETSVLDPETATACFCRHLFVVGSRHWTDSSHSVRSLVQLPQCPRRRRSQRNSRRRRS